MIIYRKLPDVETAKDINTLMHLLDRQRLTELSDQEAQDLNEISEGLSIFSALRALKILNECRNAGPAIRRRY